MGKVRKNSHIVNGPSNQGRAGELLGRRRAMPLGGRRVSGIAPRRPANGRCAPRSAASRTMQAADEQALTSGGGRAWKFPSALASHPLPHRGAAMRALEQFATDLRHAARAMTRTPSFSVFALATLTLGLVAAVTVFSVVDAVFLRPLDVPAGARLVRIHGVGPDRGGPESLGLLGARWLREHARSFDRVAAHYSTAPFYVGIGGDRQEIMGAVVSADYFPMLGLHPRLGRFFTAAEDAAPDRDAVAVISEGLWRARFGGDVAALGR